MFRSLHMKLMLIMTLLIISLMTVVGAFLINSVANYYTQDFYTQMSEAFGDPDFWKDLEPPIEGEEDAASSIAHILDTNSTLGIDNRSRKYYVLDGTDGHWLAGSDDKESGQAMPNDSRNLMRVLAGEDASDDNSPAAAYMDVAVAVQRGEGRYIVYVQDNGANVSALNSELITLIVEALIFGLIISVLLSFLLSKTLITPIERLTEGAERVADGDFSHKIEVASRDEIGVLTGTFNDMAQQLKRLGYSAYAYHDHTYTYYDRNLSHPNLGYVYRALGNGLDVEATWPESDIEMIDKTTADYMGSEPFHAYYMTVSGHLEYNFNGNAMAKKNQDLVKDLPYSDSVRAYLACQIELDRALELLLQRLDEAGVAENTVIALTGDHYPYGLTDEEQGELAGHEIDTRFERYRNAFILYKKGMKPERVDSLCCTLDILPTLSNLFGLDFDSRLYMGRDVFSDAEPFVLLRDHSWITENAMYYAPSDELIMLQGNELSPEEVEERNQDVSNRFRASAWVLDQDYWRYLFGDNLPPDGEN